MTTTFYKSSRVSVLLALALGVLSQARAQFEVSVHAYTRGYQGAKPDGINPPTFTVQFSGQASSMGASVAIGITVAGSVSTPIRPAGGSIRLLRSSFGGVVAPGVPRYALGDVFQLPDPPPGAAANYWRTEPVKPGEVFSGVPTLQVPANSVPAYYYSPHADRVFASQAGPVDVTWVTRSPVVPPGESTPRYVFHREFFAVTSATKKPVRTLYWTERGFSAPTLRVPDGKIDLINPVFNKAFPAAVANEYKAPGGTSTAVTGQSEEKRTVWFDRIAGIGQLHAYNHEGRLIVEHLGPQRPGAAPGVHQFLGADIVDVIRVITPVDYTVNLGNKLTPRSPAGALLPGDGTADWIARPVASPAAEPKALTGSVERRDGGTDYYAERENPLPEKVAIFWMEKTDAGIHFLPAPTAPNLDLLWPKVRNHYAQIWSPELKDYAHYTVGPVGSTPATGIQFPGGQLPQVVFQDDQHEREASFDTNSQRLVVTFAGGSDGYNRSLLKFSAPYEVWYVPLYTQAENRPVSITVADGGSGYVSPPQVVFGAGASATGTATIANGRVTGIAMEPGFSGIRPGVTTVTLVGGLGGTIDARAASAMILGFFEGDGLDPVRSLAVVGSRIEPPTSGNPNDPYLAGGYIASGRNYLPTAYRDPFSVGPVAAEQGAIIPVNAKPGENELKIWWFRKRAPESATFQTFYVPAKVGWYSVSYPATAPTIVLASNSGSGDLSAAQLAGSVYTQNDAASVGFNPNEEHALIKAGRVYALRDDLNVTTGQNYTSQPFVLLSYVSAVDSRPAMTAFKVLREDPANGHVFDYPVIAGSQILPPMPLAVEPPPIDPDSGDARNIEVEATPDTPAAGTAPAHYQAFTIEDRKGYHWVYRGPHAAGTPSLGMRFYYTMREGFFVPGLNPQPRVGAILPYLRPLDSGVPVGDAVNGTPLTIKYRPVWPANAPELRVGETLTMPKFGLPSVLTQTSAEVVYQQSVAVGGASSHSVLLHDPIREKIFYFGGAGQLAALPKSIATTDFQGIIYFQGLPPDLQDRVFFDPNRGLRGALVLRGKFVDEATGEDYLHLNVLTNSDILALSGLVADSDPDAVKWRGIFSAIPPLQLVANMETYVPDASRAGAYKLSPIPEVVGPASAVSITRSDTVVTDYALSATGKGSGWVSMIFGNGRVATAEAEPITVAVFKVAPRLYTGELKVLPSSNPLDEQVSLRHSGDFAALPEDYEFEWRYSAPKDGGAPPVYGYTWTQRLGTTWYLVKNPTGPLPAASAAGETVTLPRAVQIKDANFTIGATTPGLVAQAVGGLDLSGGLPARVLFSADLSDANAGLVLYVNGVVALAYKAPSPFTNATPTSSGAVNDALPLQFEVASDFFRPTQNTVEVALFTTSDRGVSSSINFRLHATSESDLVASPQWVAPTGTLENRVVVGGSPSAPLGSPLLVMSDNYFTMRYRPKINRGNILASGSAQNEVPWSRWMEPKLVEGWIKRVLAGINPFNQRITDLYNNAVNTDVSLLTQAGKRWEGDVALNLQNIDRFGLIEIYETVLNRGRRLTIDAGYDYGPANDALLLAAGYLNDLYTLHGNEAYADAANPTISVDDSATATEVSTSRFSFEGQVKSVLEEELALLRGRDDSLSTGVTSAPAYNRLYWNYTRGINSGEALYAVNYNIREKAGSSTADGKLDAADAQRMFPQAHGDAYGHYLTALKGYTNLLRNPKFTWTPRSESVTVLGKAVQIDYFDERKFAAAAVNLGRTAQQVIALTQRQSYRDDPASGWTHFRDGRYNATTNTTRYWGVDEWTIRATQGAYFNWMLGNSMLPDVDNNPQHTGVQIVDRTTVPELVELTTLAADFQATNDSASSFLNPLGLSPSAIAFDISPAELKAGKSHFDQIYERSLRATLNAKGAFDQAARMTRLLRNQENQVASYNDAIVEQEMAIEDQLIEIYGTPYPSEIGAGKTYAEGYAGPDLLQWFIVDRIPGVIDTSPPVSVDVRVPIGFMYIRGFNLPLFGVARELNFTTRTIALQPDRYVQFSDTWAGGSSMGVRAATGKLQQALVDRDQALVALMGAARAIQEQNAALSRRYELALVMFKAHADSVAAEMEAGDKIYAMRIAQATLESVSEGLEVAGEKIKGFLDAAAEALPKVTGIDNDISSVARSFLQTTGRVQDSVLKGSSVALNAAARGLEVAQEKEARSLEQLVTAYGFSYEQAQVVYEYELALRELTTAFYEIVQLATAVQRADAEVRTLIFLGNDLQADREVFRKRAAAIVQGYRTKDITFRVFRNEALEQYRSLYDLAGRYTYLAAKAYDYETGLLGSTAGQAVLNGIVASRALGDLTGGVPQATVSTLGDSGLAGTMARLQADWAVAKGRLGINNPDQNGTLFSLRRELFRIVDGAAGDTAWQQTLEQHIMTNVMADSDVAAAALNLKKPDGSAVGGIVIPFSTTIQHGMNFFGLPSANGDHNFSPSNYATKIYSVGVVLPGYIGMDPYAQGTPNAGGPNTTSPNGLNATPYVYLIPTGTDYMLAPPLGDTNTVRAFDVRDQALPLPFNLGATAFSATQFFNANGTLSEAPWILRKHPAFRPVSDPAFFFSTVPAEFTSSRLVGRSVWNGGWKLVIPAYTLLNAETEGLNRFAASVRDIQLFLRTYSHSGN